jgi:2,5-diamino-6-(ribosylamino)-4(3H)-pyrimidinone 5'-phosphate reductase
LTGADTILKAAENAPPEEESAFWPSSHDPEDRRPILAIPNSRGLVRCWHYLKTWPDWRGFVALCSGSTPQDYLNYLKDRQIDCIVAGEDHVDLKVALAELFARYGVRVVRADSGGTLNGVLLKQGLVDEVSVLVCPAFAGKASSASIFRAPDSAGQDSAIVLELKNMEMLDGDVAWLRYLVRT